MTLAALYFGNDGTIVYYSRAGFFVSTVVGAIEETHGLLESAPETSSPKT